MTLSYPESSAPGFSVSVRTAGARAKLQRWYSTATLGVIAMVRNGTLQLRVSGLDVHALLFVIPEGGEEVCVTPVPCGAARRIELPSLVLERYALAFYPIPNVQATLVHAEQLRDQRRWFEALREYDRALELDDQCYQAWRGKAYTLRELDRRKLALECASKAVEIHPEYALGWRCKGALLRDLGRHEEGLACYERGLSIDDSDEILWQNKVNALNALGRTQEAEETTRRLKERFAR
jgi:tetratricopeptide (TPR) repeat protein